LVDLEEGEEAVTMGNTVCVAGGGAPHRADIEVVNNTDLELHLDTEQDCGRECKHVGWQVLEGKILEGFLPPSIIKPHSTGRFSVSGREGTAVAPKGKVFYRNEKKGLSVTLTWNSAGWTSLSSSSAETSIVGKPPPSSNFLKKDGKPWNQVLVGEANPAAWTFTIRPREGQLAELGKTAKNLENIKVGLA